MENFVTIVKDFYPLTIVARLSILDVFGESWLRICIYSKNLLRSFQRSYVFIWVKVIKNGPSKICGRQPLKNLKLYDLLRQIISKTSSVSKISSKNFTWSILEYLDPYLSAVTNASDFFHDLFSQRVNFQN